VSYLSIQLRVVVKLALMLTPGDEEMHGRAPFDLIPIMLIGIRWSNGAANLLAVRII